MENDSVGPEMQPNRTRPTIIVGVLLICAALTVAYGRRVIEPTYRGVPLSRWLEMLPAPEMHFPGVHAKDSGEPVMAILAMDTNAVPHLLQALAAKDSMAKKLVLALNAKQDFVRFPVTRAEHRRLSAIHAFAWLGPRAASAVPRLTQLLHDPEIGPDIAPVLTYLGPDGFRALTTGLTNTNAIVAYFSAVNLTFTEARVQKSRATNESVRHFQQDAKVAVPALIQALTNRNPKISHAAATALGDIGQEPNMVVPALNNLVNRADTPASTRTAALRSLSFFRPE